MSKVALQEVVQALEMLPDSDQQLVLNFLTALKHRRTARGSRESISEKSPAIESRGNLLVFTGRVDAPILDWVEWEREQRDEELIEAAGGRAIHS